MRDESARAWSELDATGRLERLKEITKVDIFARYPREIVEGLMDAYPPQHRDKQGRAEKGWRSIHGELIRVFHTYVRYSLCFPIPKRVCCTNYWQYGIYCATGTEAWAPAAR